MAAVFAARYARAFADVVSSARLDATALDRQFNDFLGTWDGSKELRDLFVNPAAIGKGLAIFGQLEQYLKLKLVKATAFECGIVILCYNPA